VVQGTLAEGASHRGRTAQASGESGGSATKGKGGKGPKVIDPIRPRGKQNSRMRKTLRERAQYWDKPTLQAKKKRNLSQLDEAPKLVGEGGEKVGKREKWTKLLTNWGSKGVQDSGGGGDHGILFTAGNGGIGGCIKSSWQAWG